MYQKLNSLLLNFLYISGHEMEEGVTAKTRKKKRNCTDQQNMVIIQELYFKLQIVLCNGINAVAKYITIIDY